MDICKRNGKTKLLWLGDKDKTLSYEPKSGEMILTVHRWFANKSCPGNWMYARMGDLAEKVTAALGSGTGGTDGPTTTQGTQASAFSSLSEVDVVKSVGTLFTADQKKTGILASVSMAQFILESGYGKSELAQNANNVFGMKCSLSGNTWSGSTWDGKSKYTKQTKEQNADGSYTTITADFRKYPCVEDSIADHSAYLLSAKNGSKLRYDGLKGCMDYKKAAQIIKDGGYATSLTYVQNLCSIIERWNLTQFDVKETEIAVAWYRVRKTWADSKSQIGAFKVLANAKECADKNPGYSVFDVNGVNIYTPKERDEFQRLIADCEAGKIDIVLTKSISRFARNTVDLLATVRDLKEIGVEVRFEKEHALAGRIDLIITKSVSRFARNTVDSLSTIRKLKDNGCECYFEKENIWTFDSKGELLITIMSSLAQEESRSISENCTWGWRKRCADGKVTVPFGRFLGYDRGEDGNLVVNEEQAKIVRKIYGYFLQGRSPYQIAKLLTEEGIPTPGGKKVWGKAVVASILTNEKYKGDALLQKVYTTDFLTKKKKKNEGEVPQYYVEGNHEAIISPAVFDQVQILMQAREPGRNRNSCVSIFSSKIKCGDCGSWYGSKVWHSNDKYRKVIWQCNHKFDGGEKCSTPHLDEETIKQLFIKALNILAKERDLIIAGFEEIRDTAFSTEALEAEAEVLTGEVNTVAEMIQKCIDENARVAQDQTEYEKRYDALVQRFDTARAKLDETQAAITKTQAQRQMMEHFMETLRALPEQIEIFDEGTWYALCDYITVYDKDDIRVTFQNGTEIKV